MDAFFTQSFNSPNAYEAFGPPRLKVIGIVHRERSAAFDQNSVLLSPRNQSMFLIRATGLTLIAASVLCGLPSPALSQSIPLPVPRHEQSNGTSSVQRPLSRVNYDANGESQIENDADEERAGEGVESQSTGGPLDAPILKPRERRESSAGSTFAIPSEVGRNTFLALGTVVVLFLGVAWLMRKAQPRAFSALPKEAVEVLGRVPLDTRQHLQLIRLGRKLVLFGVGPQGVMPLTEVDDPQEVESLLTACKARQSGSASESFRQILAATEREPARGFLPTDRKGSTQETSYQEPASSAPRRRRTWLEA